MVQKATPPQVTLQGYLKPNFDGNNPRTEVVEIDKLFPPIPMIRNIIGGSHTNNSNTLPTMKRSSSSSGEKAAVQPIACASHHNARSRRLPTGVCLLPNSFSSIAIKALTSLGTPPPFKSSTCVDTIRHRDCSPEGPGRHLQ